MHIVTYSNGKVVEEQNSVGSEMVTKDKDGVEIGRRSLTEDELAQVAAEGKPTPDEALVTDLNAASTVADVRAALIKRFEK